MKVFKKICRPYRRKLKTYPRKNDSYAPEIGLCPLYLIWAHPLAGYHEKSSKMNKTIENYKSYKKPEFLQNPNLKNPQQPLSTLKTSNSLNIPHSNNQFFMKTPFILDNIQCMNVQLNLIHSRSHSVVVILLLSHLVWNDNRTLVARRNFRKHWK